MKHVNKKHNHTFNNRKNKLNKMLSVTAVISAFALSCAVLPACSNKEEEVNVPETQITQPETNNGSAPEVNQPVITTPAEPTPSTTTPAVTEKPLETPPKADKAEYIKITSDGVNIRAGAGTGYASLGSAEKNTLYVICGRSGNWYKTYYKNKPVYINASYCTVVQMDKSANDKIENVIEEGYKCMGVTYVYGAVRYHDGKGNRLGGFTTTAFDCSSLMQYMFKKGANVNLQMNTRTQIYQGTTVKKSALKRGDLIFFTNASRKNNTGVERVGHVAMYLGDNYILHTASDYAKIEQISSTRWSYYIQTQRMI